MVLIQEPGVVVVVHENSKCVDVLEVWRFLRPPVSNVVHGLLASEDVLNGVVHGVVENTRHWALVTTNVGWVSVECLSHLKHTRCCSVSTPEGLWHFWDGINSNSVKAEVLNDALHPVVQVIGNV